MSFHFDKSFWFRLVSFQWYGPCHLKLHAFSWHTCLYCRKNKVKSWINCPWRHLIRVFLSFQLFRISNKKRTLRYAFGKKNIMDFMDLMFRKYPPGKSHIPPKGKFGKSTQKCRMGWLLHSRNRSVPLEATFINPFVAFHRSEVENAKLEANGADDGDLKKMGGHQLGDFWGWNLQMAVSQKNGSIVFKMILVFGGCICISFFVRNIISILSVLDHIPLIYGITRVAIYSPVAKCWQFVPSAQFDPISSFLHFSRWFFKTFESESLQSKPFAPCISHAKSKMIFAQGGQSRRWWL